VAALCAVLTVFSGTATKAALCAALIFHTASKSLEVGQAQLEGANFVLATYIIGSVMGVWEQFSFMCNFPLRHTNC